MTAIKSQVDSRSAEFCANAERMKGLVLDLREKVAIVTRGGDQAARDKHLARGKMLPRERVSKLLDPGSPFLEIGQLAAWGMYGGDVHSASMICGIGRVCGRECVIVTNDATISQYDVTIRYDALGSLPGGHSLVKSSNVFTLNDAENHRRASRMRSSRRISYSFRIRFTSL